MTSAPTFARFFKCDLQMQTPLSPQWLEAETRLNADATDQQILNSARAYLRACHRELLDVIAVTDHNLSVRPGRYFVDYLNKVNDEVANEVGRQSLTIFPGFEIEAAVGKGFHVVCLFPPETQTHVLDSRLSGLGLPSDQRFDKGRPLNSSQNLEGIIEVVQKNPSFGGIVIAAHARSNSGLYDNNKMTEWLQQSEHRNPDLWCIEVEKPLNQMNPLWQNLLGNTTQCDPAWKRSRSFACIMSSDAYRMNRDPSQEGNCIGGRFSWIKMSRPSIESLRQAFLDHESRIRLTETNPDLGFGHPAILSCGITGGRFLRKIERVDFSPNLNTVIGPRGAGKSTLVDYLRLALGHLDLGQIPVGLQREVEGRALGTLGSGAQIIVNFRTHGSTYRVTYTHGESPVWKVEDLLQVGSPLEVDLKVLFPCKFLSQREIDNMASAVDQSYMSQLLDGFINTELSVLRQQEAQAIGTIRGTETDIQTLQSHQNERLALQTQLLDLQRQQQASQQANQVLAAWNLAESQRAKLEAVQSRAKLIVENVESATEGIALPELNFEDTVFVGSLSSFAETYKKTISEALRTLLGDLAVATDKFRAAVMGPDGQIQKLIQSEWQPMYDSAREGLAALAAAMSASGGAIDELTSLPTRLAAVQSQIAVLDEELKSIGQLESERKEALGQLATIWVEQTQARQTKAEQLMSKLRPSPESNPYVHIEIQHQGNEDGLMSLLSSKLTDRRSLRWTPDFGQVAKREVLPVN